MAGRKGAKVGGKSLVTRDEHIAEEHASLRHAIKLVRQYSDDPEQHVRVLERLDWRLAGRFTMPTTPNDMPPNIVERREPTDPMQSIMAAMVRVGRKSTE